MSSSEVIESGFSQFLASGSWVYPAVTFPSGSAGSHCALPGSTTAVPGEYLDDPIVLDFCARLAMGTA